MSGELELLGELIKAANESGLTKAGGNLAGKLMSRWSPRGRSQKAIENRRDLLERAAKYLEDAGVEVEAPAHDIAECIVIMSDDEDREELRDVWARLLAAACDPRKSKNFRREFISIAKDLIPLEVLILKFAQDSEKRVSNQEFAMNLNIPLDKVTVSTLKLARLGLLNTMQNSGVYVLDTLGRLFMKAVQYDHTPTD
jgi:hypothetical protein